MCTKEIKKSAESLLKIMTIQLSQLGSTFNIYTKICINFFLRQAAERS